jgi:hypothetical protein
MRSTWSITRPAASSASRASVQMPDCRFALLVPQGQRQHCGGILREAQNVLQAGLQQVGVAQQHLVELGEGAGGGVEQGLAAVDGAAPVGLQQGPDLGAHPRLLQVEPPLPPLDAPHQIPNGDAQIADHAAPVLGAGGQAGHLAHLGQLGLQRPGQEREALDGEGLIRQVELDQGDGQAGEGELARAGQIGAVHPHQEALVAQALDGISSARLRVIAPLHHLAHLEEEVDQGGVLEGGHAGVLRAQVQGGQEAQIDGLELEAGAVAGEALDEAVGVHGAAYKPPATPRKGRAW